MWAQILSAILGIWLMAAPAVLGYIGPARTNDHIVGPVAAAFAIIAVWEVTRELRWVNLAIGAWLLIAPLVLSYPTVPTVNSLVVGVLLGALAFFKGDIHQRFGGGWSSLFGDNERE